MNLLAPSFVWLQRGLLIASMLALAACAQAKPRHARVLPQPAVATATPPPAHVMEDFIAARGLDGEGQTAERDRGAEMQVSAMSFLGVPYRFGGTSADTGFDCSGFTRHIFEHSLGLTLPRRAEDQARLDGLEDVDRGALKPGDLVFFNTMRRRYSHVGIYVGDDRFVHAPRTGARVRVEALSNRYWAQRFDGARRAPGVSERNDGRVDVQMQASSGAAQPR